MKSVKDLFHQLSRIIEGDLALFDEKNNLVASSVETNSNRDAYDYVYSIQIQEGYCLYLASRVAIVQETLELIRLLIFQAYHQTNNLSREEILLSILKGGYDPLIIKGARQNLLKGGTSYRVALVKGDETEGLIEIYTLLKEVYRGNNFITIAYTDEGIVMLVVGEAYKPIAIAKEVRETINSELLIDLKIIISKPYHSLEDISTTLMDLKGLMAIGDIFSPGRHILISDEMNLEQLIYSIPFDKREKIYIELFKKDIYDKMEEDLYHTAEVFINNDLNLSETAGKLYVHRNTLNYRLDKLLRETGLDLRKFNDAMFFKISWLLKKSIIIKR